MQVHLPGLARLAQHVEEEADVVDVQPHDFQRSEDVRILGDDLELIPTHGAGGIQIKACEYLAQVLRGLHVGLALLKHHYRPIRLRQLHGILDKHPGQDIEQCDLCESHDENEESGGDLRRLNKGVIVRRPIIAARGCHVIRHHRAQNRTEVKRKLLHKFRVRACARHIVGNTLNRGNGEDVEDKAQQGKAPTELDEGAQQRLQHAAKR
mmetsp:Transcript_52926/g.148514  ORF Transcript_52926/g.148514 Transcript_52926/m.148514 type:complete len:209 (-) Transcript_52926:350-976(-)